MFPARTIGRWLRPLAATLACLAALGAGAAELYGPEAKDARQGGTLTVGSLVERQVSTPSTRAPTRASA